MAVKRNLGRQEIFFCGPGYWCLELPISMCDSKQLHEIHRRYADYLSKIQPTQLQPAIRAIVAAESLASTVNELGFDEKAFAFALSNQHRTLQQNMMRAFLAFARQLADDYSNGNFDLRNEASCKLALEISKLDLGLPFI